MAINNRKLLLLCNPGFPGRNHVSCVPNVLQRYKDYFMSPVGGAWIDGEYGEIIEEPQGMSVDQELTWLTGILGEINRNADFPSLIQISYLLENQMGFKKRGDSPTTIPQQFQLV